MSAETSVNLRGIFCAIVVTVFTSVPSGQLWFSALKVSHKG